MNIPNFDRYIWQEEPEPRPVATCAWHKCKKTIYEGDDCYEYEGELYCCEKCVHEAAEITYRVAGE